MLYLYFLLNPVSISVCFMRTQDDIERQGSVLVDYADLMENVLVDDTLHELATELKEKPEAVLNCLGLAIHQVHRQTDRPIPLQRYHSILL